MTEVAGEAGDGLGVLVVKGLLLAELSAGRARAGTLLGSGDLLRPWDLRGVASAETMMWRALSDCRLAVLDATSVRRLSAMPTTTTTLLSRATQTSCWLLASSLIISSPMVEHRVILELALLAERWGKVTPTGVRLELPLTHDVLATLVASRRPTVTVVLNSLQRRGVLVHERRHRWLLRRAGPSRAGEWGWRQFADALGVDPGPAAAIVTPRVAGLHRIGHMASSVHSTTLYLRRGPFDPRMLAADPSRCLGLLIVDGLINVELRAGRGHVGWLVGVDDVLRPWEMEEITLAREAQWRALTPVTIVRLDSGLRRDPSVLEHVIDGALQTSQWLQAKTLVVASPCIQERLRLLFTLLGDRWGRVTPAGIRLDLPLTHDLLARLCGARRPSVSVALHALAQNGLLTRAGHFGWVLHPHPGTAAREAGGGPTTATL